MSGTDGSRSTQDDPSRHMCSKSDSNKQTSFPLTDLPTECLPLICQHLPDSNSKLAAMRTCRALQSAVLETCVVLLKRRFPLEPVSNRDPQLYHLQQRRAREHEVQVLQRAQQVSLEIQCERQQGMCAGQALVDMHNWLTQMYLMNKGPFLSVIKVTLKGAPSPVSTLPSWFPIYCPNVTHLVADVRSADTQFSNMDLMACRVYGQLRILQLRDESVSYPQHINQHMRALLTAPQVACRSITTSEGLWLHTTVPDTHVKRLNVGGTIRLNLLCHEPWNGHPDVEHLVIGSLARRCWSTLYVLQDGIDELSTGEAIRGVLSHLRSYSQVTLSTDGGLVFDFRTVDPVFADLMIPLLVHARPHTLPLDQASGTLTILGLSHISVDFLGALCNALPHTITRVVFKEPSICVYEAGALQSLLLLMPPHVTSFTLLNENDKVCWPEVYIACRSAIRPITLIVPFYRSMGSKYDMREPVTHFMPSHCHSLAECVRGCNLTHQYVSMRRVDFAYC